MQLNETLPKNEYHIVPTTTYAERPGSLGGETFLTPTWVVKSRVGERVAVIYDYDLYQLLRKVIEEV